MLDPASIPAALRAQGQQTRHTLAARIEDASLSVSQPAQQSFFDGWLLRYSPGKAKRARSINSIGAGVLPFAEKLSHCLAFYRHHRLPCLFRITPFSQPHNLDTRVGRGRFRRTSRHPRDVRCAFADFSQARRRRQRSQWTLSNLHQRFANCTASTRPRQMQSAIDTSELPIEVRSSFNAMATRRSRAAASQSKASSLGFSAW